VRGKGRERLARERGREAGEAEGEKERFAVKRRLKRGAGALNRNENKGFHWVRRGEPVRRGAMTVHAAYNAVVHPRHMAGIGPGKQILGRLVTARRGQASSLTPPYGAISKSHSRFSPDGDGARRASSHARGDHHCLAAAAAAGVAN